MLKSSLLCLALVVHNESKGELELGKHAVGHTVLNRAEKHNKSICKVVYEPGQYYTKPVNKKHESWEDSVSIAKRILNGKIKDPTNGATHFHNHQVKPKWKLKRTKRIGKHTFYR